MKLLRRKLLMGCGRPDARFASRIGRLPEGVKAKYLAIGIISEIETYGCAGYVIEYAGEAVREQWVERRMTVNTRSMNAGARAGMVAANQTTFAYVTGRRFSPRE